MLLKALLGIASALLLIISLQAQSESTPLQVTVKPTGQQKQFVSPLTNQSISVPELSFDIRNVSQKCIVGISIRTEDKDSEGRVMATGGATFFRQHDGKLNCLEPGQTFRELDRANSLDKYGNPSSKEDVTVDFVLFSDGSTWGPGKDLEQKGYLRGKFDAYKQIQSQCGDHDLSAAIRPDVPAYAEAMELAKTLEAHGFTVKCVLQSTMVGLFQGQIGAALYRTSRGDFSASLIPKTQQFAVRVNERQENGRYLYTFEGNPPSTSGPINSSRLRYYAQHANAFFETSDKQVAEDLEKSLNSQSSP